MVTIDDIATVVAARLAAVVGASTTCPGGHWFGRGPDSPSGYPYDVFAVEAQAARATSGALYDQTFVVRLAGYCPIGDTGVNVQAVAQLFHDALVSIAANTAIRAVSLRSATEKVLAGRPSAARGEYDRSLRDGKDVFVTGLTAEIVVVGDRSQS